METVASLFGGNPFSTVVGQKIEQATEAALPSENWALNMEICDIINETEEGPKDAIKAIRKRFQQAAKNFTVVLYTLTVLETCVKNCGRRFHLLACNRDFVQELVKLIGPKNEPPTVVQDKVLNLIQCWADAFRNIPELSGVVQMYHELKAKGIEFPMTDLDSMAPIHTPQRSQPEEVSAPIVTNHNTALSSSVESPLKSGVSNDYIAKLTNDLQVVEGNMTVLSEMLSELQPGEEHPSDLQLLQELYTTCQSMQERLVELISQLANEEITGELLRVNDGLNNLFLRYSRYEKKRTGRNASSGVASDEAQSPLIDLDEGIAGLSLQTQLSSIPSVNATTSSKEAGGGDGSSAAAAVIDEFDMFAHSRNITYESSKVGASSYEANKETLHSGSLAATAEARLQTDASSNSKPLAVPDLVGVHSERDFMEMAQWLGEKPEESLSSSEFERFLAERAAAAEALPSALSGSETNPSNESGKSKSTSNKKREDEKFAL